MVQCSFISMNLCDTERAMNVQRCVAYGMSFNFVVNTTKENLNKVWYKTMFVTQWDSVLGIYGSIIDGCDYTLSVILWDIEKRQRHEMIVFKN